MKSMPKFSRLLTRLAIGLLVLATISRTAVQASTMLFEDRWPSNGDLDFNDQVVRDNYTFTLDASGRVVGLQATYNVLAIGSGISNGLYLHLPVAANLLAHATIDLGQGAASVSETPGESQLVLPIVNDTRQLYGSGAGLINTDPALPQVPTAPPIHLDLLFSQPIALDLSEAPFDLFIARTADYGHQIHLPQYPGTDRVDLSLFGVEDDASTSGRHFVNKSGIPFALEIPSVTSWNTDTSRAVWPKESVPIDVVYPDILTFASSGGTQAMDWYNNPNMQYLYPLPEPSTVVLGAFGLLGLSRFRRHKQYPQLAARPRPGAQES